MNTEERLEKLEKELARAKRRSRVMLVAVVMTVIGVFLLGAGGESVPKRIRAQEFDVVDASGGVRAALLVSENGAGPSLKLYDQNGEPCVVLGMGDSGPALGLCDRTGTTRIALAMLADGEPTLSLYDQNDTARAVLAIFAKSGQPMLGLADQNGKSRIGLGMTKSGQPMLGLYDQDGKVIWRTP